jgi:hypothetical protein
VEPATLPPGWADMPEPQWRAQRNSLQAAQQAQDLEVMAFYEGRLSVRDSKVDWRGAGIDLPGADANDTLFASCQRKMREIRHMPQPVEIPTPPMP